MLVRRRRWNPLKLLLWFLFQQRRARPVGRGKTGKERRFHKLLLLLEVTAEFLGSKETARAVPSVEELENQQSFRHAIPTNGRSRPYSQWCDEPKWKPGPKFRAPSIGYRLRNHSGLIPIQRVPRCAAWLSMAMEDNTHVQEIERKKRDESGRSPGRATARGWSGYRCTRDFCRRAPRSRRTTGAEVRYLHRRSSAFSGLVAKLRCDYGSHGIDRRILDPAV